MKLEARLILTLPLSKNGGKMKPKVIKDGDLVLLYDSRFQKFPGKFKIRWQGPYKVLKAYDNGSFDLEDFQGNLLPTRINGNRLKV